MMTTTTQALLNAGTDITNDRTKSKGFFAKPKSQETIQKERATARYESRKNICLSCFQAKSITGACACDL